LDRHVSERILKPLNNRCFTIKEQTMNLNLVIIGLMISSVLAISASGHMQKTVQKVILQDDKSGDHLIFVIPDGEYKFESCKENFATSGVGTVDITGCKVVLRDISETRLVLAEVDLCDRTGKAAVSFKGDGSTGQAPDSIDVVVSDSNTGDSAFGCQSKQIQPK
jgi:hypothetical protein